MKYKMNIRIVRVFNTYGPRMHPDDGRVISNFCVQSLKDLPHTIYGDGNQTRSLCYFSDMINGFVEIMNLKDEYVFPVNLGSNFEYSINTISNLISNLVGVKNKVNYVDLPQDDPLLRKPDLTRAKNLISWNPSVSVEEGITNIISYYREKMANDLNIATS